MKLGMFTACLPRLGLEEVAEYAASAGYQALEVAVWPGTSGRDFQAAHIPVADFGPAGADEVRRLMAARGLEISALGYYDNNLHPDPDRRAAIRAHLSSRRLGLES